MDEDILDDVYNTLNGFEYIPYELDYKCFPNLEIGDVVTIEQSVGSSWLETTETWGNADFAWDRDFISFNVIVLYNQITYKGGLRSTLKADSESQQTSEFKVKGSLRQYIENIDKNTIKEGKVYNGVTTSREEGVVVERSDGKAKTIMNATEGISIYSDLGSGLTKNFFVGLDGRIQAKGIDIDGSGTFSGELNAAGGTFSGDLSAAGGTFSGDLVAAGGTFSGDLVAAGGTFGGRVTAQHVILNDGESTGSLNFMNNGTYTTFKTNYTTGGNTLIIGRTTSLGATPSLLQRMDIFANWLYVYNNLYVANRIEIGGKEVATVPWCYNNFLLYGENEYVSSYYPDQKITLAATDTGIAVLVDGIFKGNIFYD